MAKNDIDNFLDETDDAIKPDNRFPDLGNGKYELKVLDHEWATDGAVGTFVANVEVVASEPTGVGLKEWHGETFDVTQPGDRSTLRMWGFKHPKRHNMAMGKLKSYLGALLAHKGVTAKGTHKFAEMARRLVKNDEAARSLFEGRTIKVSIKVNPPAADAGPEAKPWRLVSYL